jgi:hypothetical protein
VVAASFLVEQVGLPPELRRDVAQSRLIVLSKQLA